MKSRGERWRVRLRDCEVGDWARGVFPKRREWSPPQWNDDWMVGPLCRNESVVGARSSS